MKNENGNENKGLFSRLAERKPRKGSCCGTIELEEITEKIVTNEKEEGCSCSSIDCCGPINEKKKIAIDFLYLDLNVCTRCQGTDNSLDEAVSEVSKVLEAAGTEVVVNKINVVSEALAIQHKFISSPTIRVNGNDIQVDVKESLCESCGDLCGDEVDCRVWTYQGQEYTVPPKAMIIEAMLREVYGNGSINQESKQYEVPENLRHFYASMSDPKDC